MDFQEIICNKNLIIANKGAITGGVLTCLFFDVLLLCLQEVDLPEGVKLRLYRDDIILIGNACWKIGYA